MVLIARLLFALLYKCENQENIYKNFVVLKAFVDFNKKSKHFLFTSYKGFG